MVDGASLYLAHNINEQDEGVSSSSLGADVNDWQDEGAGASSLSDDTNDTQDETAASCLVPQDQFLENFDNETDTNDHPHLPQNLPLSRSSMTGSIYSTVFHSHGTKGKRLA